MRKLILAIALLWCLPSVAAVTLVQAHTGTFTANTSIATAAFTNNTVGNIGVVAVQWCSTTGNAVTISTVTDTAGNTYTISAASKASIAATHFADCNTQFAYNTNLLTFTGTNTVTVTYPSANANLSIGVFELTAGSFDQVSTGTNANTNLPTPGSITTATNGSFYVVAGIIDDGFGLSSGWFAAGSGFTLNTENGGGNMNTANEYQAQTTAGALTGVFVTNFSGTTGPNAGSMITFKPATTSHASKVAGPSKFAGPSTLQ